MKKLSKDEMKKVMGGIAQVTCTYTAAPGYTITSQGSCDGTPDQCQAAADNWCWSHDSCANVDCVGAS